MNNKNSKIWLAGVCVATLLFLMSPVWSGEQGDNAANHEQRRQHREQRLAKISERISERIQKIQERMNAHPNAPAEVKAAANKLLADLKDALADIGKIKTALAAHDKATLQSMKGELKKDREVIKTDRQALREVVRETIKNKRQEHRGEHKNGKSQQTAKA